MNFVSDMVVPTFRHCAIRLGKDPATWVGSVTSTLATIVAPKDGFFPGTMESWLAAMLTMCTICYMVSKMIILFRKEVKQVELAND